LFQAVINCVVFGHRRRSVPAADEVIAAFAPGKYDP
jgi:hypothetical protein